LHPIHAVPADQSACSSSLPKCCRDHVYVFLINGADPLKCANLAGVRDYLIELGYPKIYYGEMYHTPWFASEVRHIRQQDVDARFVVVGYSLGANLACSLVQAAKEEGFTIDLLVYLGGIFIANTPASQPENVGRIVNVLADGCLLNGDQLDRATNFHAKGVWHFGSPTHPDTLAMLADELAQFAATVPVQATVPPSSQPEQPLEEGPTPRPVPAQGPLTGEWDFLGPASRLKDAQYNGTRVTNLPH
jgi:hypothetical protein